MKLFRILSGLLHVRSPHPISKRLFRFLYWQLYRKHFVKPFVFSLPDGAIMSLEKGQQGSSGFYYLGYPDFEEMMGLKNMLIPGDLFVDVGANAGGWSLSTAGMGARCMAFEPISSTYHILQQNFSLNPSLSLTSFKLGVSSRQGEMLMTNDADAGNHIVVDVSQFTEQIKVVSLDEFLHEHEPAFIKIDVEGHELPVILGAKKILTKPSLKMLVIETFRWANYSQPSFSEMESILEEFDFVPVSYNYVGRNFIPLNPNQGSQNTIYVKKSMVSNFS